MNKIKGITFLGVFVLFISCNKKESIDPEYMGKIERDEIVAVTKVPGKVEHIFVEEGDFVKKGDTLAELEMPEVDAKLAQAQGALASADAQYQMAVKGATEGQLQQLEAKVAGLKEQFDFADKSLNRLEEMLEDSLVSTQQYDEVYAKYQGAKNQYEAAKVDLEEVREGAREEKQGMASGQRQQAEGALSEALAADRERFIVAPQDMSIETINLKMGELALPAYPVFNGYIQASTYFRFTIAEHKMGAIEKGKEVTITIPYKDSKKIKGKVTMVKALESYANIATAYPDFETEQALFEVKVQPLDSDEAKGLFTKASVSLAIE